MVSESTFTTWVCEFDLGKEIEQATPDGRKMKVKFGSIILKSNSLLLQSTFTLQDGKLIEEQKKINPGDKESRFEVFYSLLYSKPENICIFQRYIDAEGNLMIECVSGEVKAVRKYQKA